MPKLETGLRYTLKICCWKNEKEPNTAHRDARRIIKLNESSQQNRCDNRSDARDDNSSRKVAFTEVGDQTDQPRKQRIKRCRAVGPAVPKFCDLPVISEISLIPHFEPLMWSSSWRDRTGVFDSHYPTDHDPSSLGKKENIRLNVALTSNIRLVV